MTRALVRSLALISLVMSLPILAGCLETHGSNNTSVRNSDCYTCHKREYDATGTGTLSSLIGPVHSTSGCDTNCVQCHTTTDWTNSLGGCAHPEANFPLTTQGTKHTNITCIACHSADITAATGATSVAGANTDCIACHPNTSTQVNNHIGVTYSTGTLAGMAYAYSTTDHRFCLDCHPKGLAVGHGANNPFVLPHHGAACAQCHDNASGLGPTNGADVLCVTSGCHGNAHHKDTNHHPACLNSGCHPDGRGGG